MCYSHAFSQVAKSHVLVHNYEPFRHWDMIIIDNDGQPKTKNGHEMKAGTGANINTMPINKFLIANNGLACTSFPHWNFYPCYKGIITSIQSNVFEQFYTTESSILRRESTWRRVYDATLTFFFCEYDDFSLYVLEQKLHKTPINVFKTVLEREIGICFNQKSVLKTIASPYYYVLPHQDERNAKLNFPSSSHMAGLLPYSGSKVMLGSPAMKEPKPKSQAESRVDPTGSSLDPQKSKEHHIHIH
ncbi:uncharacterized protein TNCV_3405261 [Trichonephila clavipes]|nr:uncharacterized protein TNCV_3405261 [Trichonephila clavipes]